jgi:hypothetical protein
MGAAQNIFNGFLRVTLAEKNPGLGRLQAEQKKLLVFKVLEQIAGVRSKAAPLTFLRRSFCALTLSRASRPRQRMGGIVPVH